MLSIERPLFNIKRVSSWLAAKFVSISNQWEVYLGSELVEQHGFFDRYLLWQWIDENIESGVDSFSSGIGDQPSIEKSLFSVFQCIGGNKVPSGYINGILDPQHVATIFCKKKLWQLLPLIWCFFLVKKVPHSFGKNLPEILILTKVTPYSVSWSME